MPLRSYEIGTQPTGLAFGNQEVIDDLSKNNYCEMILVNSE